MRSPVAWLALPRVVTGLWFLKASVTKLTFILAGGFLPVPTATARYLGFMPKRVAESAAGMVAFLGARAGRVAGRRRGGAEG